MQAATVRLFCCPEFTICSHSSRKLETPMLTRKVGIFYFHYILKGVIHLQLTEHFTLAEFVATSTSLPNLPSDMEIERIKRTAKLLEDVRELLGHPVIISSGFRSELVNRAVGGSNSSSHMMGFAADFTCPGYGTPIAVCLAIVDAGLHFDQMIKEFGIDSKSKGGDWIHIGIGPRNRQQVLTRLPDGRYVPGINAGE